ALAEWKRLESQVGDKPVVEGKSVKQMLAGLPADSPLAKAMAPAPKWREGKIEELPAEGPGGARAARQLTRLGAINVEIRGGRGPFFQDVALGYDTSRQEIFGRDAVGKGERFSIRLDNPNPSPNPYGLPQYADHFAFAQGHLLVVF